MARLINAKAFLEKGTDVAKCNAGGGKHADIQNESV
jgi:hypothetical protein